MKEALAKPSPKKLKLEPSETMRRVQSDLSQRNWPNGTDLITYNPHILGLHCAKCVKDQVANQNPFSQASQDIIFNPLLSRIKMVY